MKGQQSIIFRAICIVHGSCLFGLMLPMPHKAGVQLVQLSYKHS